jgi:hypothetical protein
MKCRHGTEIGYCDDCQEDGDKTVAVILLMIIIAMSAVFAVMVAGYLLTR